MNKYEAEDLLRIAALDSANSLKQAALEYNWDDGLGVPFAIANHPKCDLAVALELFWVADAVEVHLGHHISSPWSEDWVQFCELLINRLLAGYYKQGEASFIPDLTKVQIYKYRKQNVPELFLSAVTGQCRPLSQPK